MGLFELTARQLAQEIAAGRISSLDATRAILERIDKVDPQVGAYLHVCRDHALTAARRVDEKIAGGGPVGALAGVPIAIKDNLCTRFAPTSCASKILDGFVSPYDAHVVEQLAAADAVIVGKTNLDEFAMGSSTENSGLGKTVNPWNPQCVPGGSSGGSAAAMAAHLAWAAIGSDTGGSIRQPASFCGVVGLKPTYGRVSRYGLVAYGSSLDQIGPVTRNVADAAWLMNVIAGHDARDSTSVSLDRAPVPDYLADLDEPISDLKIGIVPALNDAAEAGVVRAVEKAVSTYADSGAKIVEITMPHFDYTIACYYILATAEASSNLARYDGVHYGHRTDRAGDYIDVYTRSRAEGFGTEVKRRIMLGTYALSSGYYDAYYLKALKVRQLIRSDFTKAFSDVDCIMMPVAPTTAFKIGEKMTDPLQMYLADVYTLAANLAGVPGLSIPCGFDERNLPIGLQILSPPFTEDRLLRIGRMYEARTDWTTKHPPIG